MLLSDPFDSDFPGSSRHPGAGTPEHWCPLFSMVYLQDTSI